MLSPARSTGVVDLEHPCSRPCLAPSALAGRNALVSILTGCSPEAKLVRTVLPRDHQSPVAGACRVSPHGRVLSATPRAIADELSLYLHHHVVARSGGDTNFMPVVRPHPVLPQLLADTRKLLAADAWPTAA